VGRAGPCGSGFVRRSWAQDAWRQRVNGRVLRRVPGICLAVSVVPKIIAQTQTATPETMVSMKIADWSLQSSALQSSANVPETGESLSNPTSEIAGWPTAAVPGTVLVLPLPHVDYPKQNRYASILLVGM
jgi:hypothetical protein